MIQIRPADERFHSQMDWLDSRHTFSFNYHHDPAWMGFRSLRVINEDWIAPSQGFGAHPHRDMEIVTWILDGELEHRDSTGNSGILRPGEIQRMSAGTGVRHSEFNHSDSETLHLLQIWLLPERNGLTPSYEQKTVPEAALAGKFQRIAAPAGRNGTVQIHQDAVIYAARLAAGETASLALDRKRYAWVQVARGAVKLNGKALKSGDGAAVSDETQLEFKAEENSEVLVFDLA